MGLLETVAATLIGGERRIETAARNVTNVNTPGYKREVAFTQLINSGIAAPGSDTAQPTTSSVISLLQGTLVDTGNPLDLAVDGSAYLLVRDGNRYALSRGGQFALGSGGRLIDALGRILQQAGGGDLEIAGIEIKILADGTVLDRETPVGAIGLYRASDSNHGASMMLRDTAMLEEDAGSEVRQGMVERSNVILSDEMVELMRTQRQVEGGAQLVRAYDQLMSQAISTFSRRG